MGCRSQAPGIGQAEPRGAVAVHDADPIATLGAPCLSCEGAIADPSSDLRKTVYPALACALMARTTAEHLIKHLELSGFVVMRKPPAAGHKIP